MVMGETPRQPASSTSETTPDSGPFDNKLREVPPPADEQGSDTIFTQEPAAGVTDVNGRPLAGDAHGGTMGN